MAQARRPSIAPNYCLIGSSLRTSLFRMSGEREAAQPLVDTCTVFGARAGVDGIL